jgi:glutamyl/glutaminyl-tRNA synthetase
VIRGEEHISNTPKQLALYKALDASPPLFAHLPTLRNKERKKLSKRKDPVDLRIFRKDGYLPEALVNFLCLLGWSHPDEKEIFSLEEFVKLFSLDRVRKAGPIFDTDKLDWMNGVYIRKTQNPKLKSQIYEFLDKKHAPDLIGKTIPLVKERINKLSEYWPLAGFFFERRRVDKKLLGKSYKLHVKKAIETLSKVVRWGDQEVDEKLTTLIKENGFKTGDFFMDLRVAITGSRVTPPINESIVILGRGETLARLKKVISSK